MKKFMTDIKTLAALLMAGAAFTACSSDDNIIEQPQNPTEPKVYTLVIKASKGTDTTTRALKDVSGEIKAFWSGTETIEVGQYNYATEKYDIIGEATAAYSPNGNTTITAELDYAPDPDKDLNFFLGGSTLNFTGQVGLLTGTNSISEKYDYASDCLTSGSFTVDEINNKVIPNKNNSRTLEFGAAEQAIIKFTLKDKANNEAISPTAFTVSDGTNTVELTSIPTTTYDTNGDGVLYVAFPPGAENTTITLTATVGGDTYTYTTTSPKTFYRGQYYEITVKMTKQAPSYDNTLNINTYDPELNNWENVTVPTGKHWLITGTGEATTNVIIIANNATVTLSGVNITAWGRSITCVGNATIILADGTTNNLYSAEGEGGAAGIEMRGGSGTSLTIQGNTGVLNITSGSGPAIGAGYGYAGCAINIEGGIINATSTDGPGIGAAYNTACGNITISGGTVAATGGYGCPGIGGASSANCGDITITSGVTSVTATKGSEAPYSIGASSNGSCGTVTIGCTLDGSGNPVGGATGQVSTSPFTYPAPPTLASESFTTNKEITTYNGTHFTITCTNVGDEDGILIGRNNTLTITAKGSETIKKVEFRCDVGYFAAGQTTVTAGTLNWTGSSTTGSIDNVNATTVTMSNSNSGWITINQITVYYE